MTDNKDLGGRPEISEEDKKQMVSKLEPYLKSGLSIRKSLFEAQIPKSSFYKAMERDEEFRDQIGRFRQFVSVLLNNSVIRLLQNIVKTQNTEGKVLTKDDIAFLQWFADHSTLTKDEFGSRKEISLYDPEVEIQRVKSLLEEGSTKEISDE